jgi:uncharacterized protein
MKNFNTNISSGIAPFLLLGGFLLHQASLIGLGIILFSAAVAFQVITLPVEFNASSRAPKSFFLLKDLFSMMKYGE